MGFFDWLGDQVDRGAEAAGRAVEHVLDDTDRVMNGKDGAEIKGLASKKEQPKGAAFSWGTPSSEADAKKEKEQGFTWW
jgi:hypothetical protein